MTSDSYFTLGFYVRKPQTERAEYPIFARISVAGQATEFKIGRTVDPENWDAKKHLCRGRTRRDLELNKYLEMVRAKLCDIHNMLIREKKPVNPGVLKSLFLGNGEKPKMMIEVFREANEHRKEEYERGDIVKATYQRWTRCADYMEEFFRSSLKTPDIPIKEVTSGILDDFQHYLRMKKDCANNAAVRYLRCVGKVGAD